MPRDASGRNYRVAAYAALIDVKFCKWVTARPDRHLRGCEAVASCHQPAVAAWARRLWPTGYTGRPPTAPVGGEGPSLVCHGSLWKFLDPKTLQAWSLQHYDATTLHRPRSSAHPSPSPPTQLL